jgi:microcystin-dependent protein
MSAEPFVGEIQVFPFGFAPRGWAPCNGQLLSVNNNQALFSILGIAYGGNGNTTFGLPNLNGRAPLHAANADSTGTFGGEAAHQLTVEEIPPHNHTLAASTSGTNSNTPSGNVWGMSPDNIYSGSADVTMNPNALALSGNSVAHSNMQPYLVLNYCIALTGIYPSRG